MKKAASALDSQVPSAGHRGPPAEGDCGGRAQSGVGTGCLREVPFGHQHAAKQGNENVENSIFFIVFVFAFFYVPFGHQYAAKQGVMRT